MNLRLPLQVRGIENPLNPWTSLYREEFPNLKGNQKPSYPQLEKVFRKAKITAIVGSAFCLSLAGTRSMVQRTMNQAGQ